MMQNDGYYGSNPPRGDNDPNPAGVVMVWLCAVSAGVVISVIVGLCRCVGL